MKVVHINSSDSSGGAARACIDINRALQTVGVDSTVLVQLKEKDADDIESAVKSPLQKYFFAVRFLIDYFLIKIFTNEKRGRFSFPFGGANLFKIKSIKDADIIHLHWVNQGFFSLKTFRELAKLNKPIVWTLHDMWPFTGGCHYSGECKNFLIECNNCPSLKFSGPNDFSHQIFIGKINSYRNLNLNIVACSRWLAEKAKNSFLLKSFPVSSIPNSIDTNLYKPIDKKTARRILNLPGDKKLVLFGTMNLKEERKGFQYLKKSLIKLNDNFPNLKSKMELVVFGASDEKVFEDIPFKTNFLGRLKNIDDVIYSYNSADIFVASSLEDNLPNTVMEALACGVPVAAFNIGGMPDMINHKDNGYLAEPKSIESLADGIYWLLNNSNETLSINSRKKVVENFTPELVGEMYKSFYKKCFKAKENS